MATAGNKTLCSTCQKASGILTCRGCKKDFCYRHVGEHRQELSKQMDELTTNHDQLQQTIAEQVVQPSCHPLMKKIDEWEQQSINKILQAADDARKQVLIILDTYRTQVAKDLACFTTELSKGRNEDDYVDTDLKEWTEKLDKLKSDLNAAQTIDFGEDDNDETPLISKYAIYDKQTEVFYKTLGNAQISGEEKVITHDSAHDIAVACCRNRYSSGQYRVRFKIDQLCRGIGFSCGIISKKTPLASIINTLPNNLWHAMYERLNHNLLSVFTERDYQFQTNCTYEILIDCNEKTLRLTTVQTGSYTQELNVNLATCPLPWRFFIALLYAGDRISLC